MSERMNRMERAGMLLMLAPLLGGIMAVGGCLIAMAFVGPFGPPPFMIALVGIIIITLPVGGFLLLYGQSRRHRGLR